MYSAVDTCLSFLPFLAKPEELHGVQTDGQAQFSKTQAIGGGSAEFLAAGVFHSGEGGGEQGVQQAMAYGLEISPFG